jgi:hypothetical protein
MKKPLTSFLLLGLVCFAGCSTRVASISHSEFLDPNGGERPGHGNDFAFQYRGELTEFDVLGIARGELTSEASIRRALDEARKVKLQPDSSILLIQSGALFPDGGMLSELGKHFHVMPFTGVPPQEHNVGATITSDPETFAKSLRLAAARAGNDVIVCYWGFLESMSENLATKTVSWLPLANRVLPDETQRMRIRLKLAIVDVRSGNWAVFSPAPFENTLTSERKHRAKEDQAQVEQLKAQAYEAAVADLLRLYSSQVAAR